MIIPPNIGAAMRCIVSEPVPDDHMIGARPASITAIVIAFGTHPLHRALSGVPFDRVPYVQQHYHARQTGDCAYSFSHTSPH